MRVSYGVKQGATGGKGVVGEPGVSTQTKEVGCMAGGGISNVKDTAGRELVSGRRAYANVLENRTVCCVVGRRKAREETLVTGESIIRPVNDVVCMRGPPKCVRICLPGADIQDVRNRVASVVGPRKGGRGAVLVHIGTKDLVNKGSEEVMGRYRAGVEVGAGRADCTVRDSAGERFVMGRYANNNRSIPINHGLQALCQKEGIRCGNIQWEQLYFKDGLHFNKLGASSVFLRAPGMELGNFLQTVWQGEGYLVRGNIEYRSCG